MKEQLVVFSENTPWTRFVAARFPESYAVPPLRVWELVYDAEAREVIHAKWPHARFEDASDYIHEGRFAVEIDDCDPDEFYAVMILEGWVGCCLGFEMKRLMPEHHDEVRRYIDRATAMKEAGYVHGG